MGVGASYIDSLLRSRGDPGALLGALGGALVDAGNPVPPVELLKVPVLENIPEPRPARFGNTGREIFSEGIFSNLPTRSNWASFSAESPDSEEAVRALRMIAASVPTSASPDCGRLLCVWKFATPSFVKGLKQKNK